MIRRLKVDVLSQLPSKIRSKINIIPDDKYVKEIKKILSECGNIDQIMSEMDFSNTTTANLEEEDTQTNMFQAFSKLYRLTGMAKIQGLKDYMSELIENGIKFIIFAHHLCVLDEIEKYVSQQKIKSIRIDGSVTHEKRHNRVQQF